MSSRWPHDCCTRRDFLATSASGIGLLALASLLHDEGRLIAARFAVDRQTAPLRTEGKELHLHLSRRRSEPTGFVRPQGRTQKAARAKAAGFADEEHSLCLHQEGNRDGAGQHAQMVAARPMRHGVVRPAAAPFDLRRRHRIGPLDADRRVQSSSRSVADEHRAHAVRPAEHGRMAELWPGQRIEEPARLCRADGRPRHVSGGTSNWSSGFLPSTYQGVLFRSQGDPVLNLANPAGVSRRLAVRVDRSHPRSERHSPCDDRRPGDPQPDRRLRIGVPHAVGRAGTDRYLRRNARDARTVRLGPQGPGEGGAEWRGGGTGSSTRFAPIACSRGGWSSAACGSSICSTPRGTITTISISNSASTAAWRTSRSPRCSRT